MAPRTERVLNLIALLLDSRRPLTRHEIQERIPGYPEEPETFRKAFERDKAVLRDELHIPLEIVENLPGASQPETGYIIRGDVYRLEDPGLTPDELAAINLAATRIRLGGVDPSSGLHKLGGFAGNADELATLPESPLVPVVFQAFREKRRLRFTYGDTERSVDPFRLHLERGRWYLRGHDHSRGDVRTFRLDRVVGDVALGDSGSATTAMPEELRGKPELQGWAAGEDEPIVAKVRIDADQVAVAERMVGTSTAIHRQPDGSAIFEMEVRRREGIRTFVLGFLGSAELLEPPELRDDLVEWLTAVSEGSR